MKYCKKQNLHHRTNSGKDSSNTKIVGVRNAKKSRNTPGLGSMYIERVMRVSRSHGYYVSSSCCFLFLSNEIDFLYYQKHFQIKRTSMMFNYTNLQNQFWSSIIFFIVLMHFNHYFSLRFPRSIN